MEHTYAGVRPSATPRSDNGIRLSDGRLMQVAEFGPLDGRPVVLMHGTPGSRLFCPDVGATAAAGVRLITFDRPGHGRSEPARGPMRHADVVADVVELFDLLDIDQASIIGWSGGGPYGLACGALAGSRCPSVAVACSPGEPMTERDATPEVLALSHRLAADPEAHRDELRARSQWLTDGVAEVVGEFEAGEPELFSVPGMRDAFVALVREAAVVGLDGYIDDWIADALGWGFELADVNVPVSSWYGEHDELVLGHHAALHTANLARCQSLGCDECGHLLPMAHWPAILAQLR